MSTRHNFVLTGGGTGGHVYPALAVGEVLKERGHKLLYIGTEEGLESRLVPRAGYEMKFIRSSGLNRVGWKQQLRTAARLPASVFSASTILSRFEAQAVFSLGGFVAGPVMLASLLRRIPLIVMEPNATPGFANRQVSKFVYRALLGFETTKRWFPSSRSEVTGLPVRPEFFHIQPKVSGLFSVLITGGSRGAHTLNRAARESWPLFKQSGMRIQMVHQTGSKEHLELAAEFQALSLDGEVTPFIYDMPAAFAQSDLVVGRAGAGSVSEIAAAGMASLLVPFPFAADDHQRANAQVLSDAGAARLVLDAELTGLRLFEEVARLVQDSGKLSAMRQRVRPFARPGAAERAAEVLEEAASNRNGRAYRG